MKDTTLETIVDSGIATITFGHQKSNSLPRLLLYNLADEIEKTSSRKEVKVIVLQSIGDKTFCAGASFDELCEIDSIEKARAFFTGFAKVILAMRNAPQFVVCRVQGKAVGGGVGLICAADYALAHTTASIKLSELAIGIGPFTIGAAVSRKIGAAAFGELAIDTEFKSSAWCKDRGMYVSVFDSIEALDTEVRSIAQKFANYHHLAARAVKKMIWEGTDDWPSLMDERITICSNLLISKPAQDAIKKAKERS